MKKKILKMKEEIMKRITSRRHVNDMFVGDCDNFCKEICEAACATAIASNLDEAFKDGLDIENIMGAVLASLQHCGFSETNILNKKDLWLIEYDYMTKEGGKDGR